MEEKEYTVKWLEEDETLVGGKHQLVEDQFITLPWDTRLRYEDKDCVIYRQSLRLKAGYTWQGSGLTSETRNEMFASLLHAASLKLMDICKKVSNNKE